MAEKQQHGDIRNTRSQQPDTTRNPDWKSYTPEGHGRTDEQIRADIHEEISRQAHPSERALSVTVADGFVTLDGTFDDQDAHDALCKTIRAVPSVKGLRDSSRRRSGT